MKSRLKNNVCYVLICWDHIKGFYKIILTVDRMDRIKEYYCYAITSFKQNKNFMQQTSRC